MVSTRVKRDLQFANGESWRSTPRLLYGGESVFGQFVKCLREQCVVLIAMALANKKAGAGKGARQQACQKQCGGV